MQRIERYGVIALVFLLVTVAAVSFWGDGAQEQRRKTRQEEQARLEPASSIPPAASEPAPQPARSGRPVAEPRTEPPLPVGGAGEGRRANRGAERERDDDVVQLDPLPQQEPAPPAERRRELPRNPPQSQREEPRPEPQPQARPARPAPVLSDPEVEVLGDLRHAGAPQTVEYTVKPGDTLSEIALATLGSTTRWRAIQELNAGLDPTRLKAGQKILLPKGAVFSVPPGTPPSAPTPRVNGGGSAAYHVIQPGDMLSRIAAEKLGDAGRWREIVALNPGLDPDRLLVGTRIALPATAVEPAPPVKLASADAPRPARREREHRVR